MKTKKQPALTPEESLALTLERQKQDIKTRIDRGSISKNPTRLFKIGDSVKYGHHENVTIMEVCFDGLAYHIHSDYMKPVYGKLERSVNDHVIEWTEIFPMTAYCKGEILRENFDPRINYGNSTVDSLLHKVYHSGVDFNPEYQRDLVWNMEQKISLIDSIFRNIDIGKFTFIRKDYSSDLPYEILDGKQRLSTLCEFYEDRFTWKGKKFSELSFNDAYCFTGFPIVYGETDFVSDQQVYKLFVRLNTSGTPVSKEHLTKIESLIK